jgi:hypothetical protein
MAPKIDRLLVAKAAQAVGIDICQLGADEHPWNTENPMSAQWRIALKQLSPIQGEQLEVDYGRPLSLGLTLALSGDQPMTPKLMGEWETKRPLAYRDHKAKCIAEALDALCAESEASAEANSPEARAARQQEIDQGRAASFQASVKRQYQEHQAAVGGSI